VSIEWASSVDLHVDLEAAGGRRAALERALRAAIRDGRLRAGDRVPSTRALARDLGLARGTIAEAYAQLAAEGYLRTRPGAPTLVAAGLDPLSSPPTGDAPPSRRPPPATQRPPASTSGRPSPMRRPPPTGSAAGVAAQAPRHDLRVGLPDVSAFPRAGWVRALRRALAVAPDEALTHGDPRGRPELRGALAAYLGRTRGVLADPERIVVCSGFTQGLALVCRAIGGTLAMEDPCLFELRAIAHAAGMKIAPLAVDENGALPDVPAGATAALLTPAHQFPLGATLAPERRSAFVAWARDGRGVVIEDDYDGEFRYDRQPVGALQGLDSEHVVYAGTASKTLAPGLRLGWLVLPDRLIEPVIEAKRLAGETHALEQLALAEILQSGAYDRHVRRQRQRYRRRRDQLLDLLAGRRTHGIAAGLHLVLEVESEASTLARAAGHSLALQPLAPFWHEPRASHPQGIVLGYAAPPEHAYARTLAALAATRP
jgi:GntR family transcriptional regulator/MocR family aminotransferase